VIIKLNICSPYPMLHRVLKNLDDWHGGSDGSVVIGSFIEFTTSHQHLLFPAFQMQLCLRNKSIGSSFWDQQRQRRLKMCDNKYLKLEDYLTMVCEYQSITLEIHCIPFLTLLFLLLCFSTKGFKERFPWC
jgi:hypothetical protein